MQYIKGIEQYQNENRTAVTLGKFDGLHRGHELLISRIEELQRQAHVDGVVFVFDMGQPAGARLLSNEERARMLKDRVAYLVECPFEERIAKMEPETFIEKILVGVLHVRYVVVGADFRFGYRRRGDIRMLTDFGVKYGFSTEVIEKKQYHGREISSTYIKEELKKGNLDTVDELLGYAWRGQENPAEKAAEKDRKNV